MAIGDDVININICDIFNIKELQKTQDALAHNQNIGLGFYDRDFTPITGPTNNSPVLDKMVWENENIYKYFDCKIEKFHKHNVKESRILRNKAGDMVSAVVPIILKDNPIGYCYVYGVLDEEFVKSEAEYRDLATKCGANPDEFIQAISNIPVMKKHDFMNVYELVGLFVVKLTDAAYSEYKNKLELEYSGKLLNELKIQNERYRMLSKAAAQIIYDYDVKTDTAVLSGYDNTKNDSDGVLTHFRENKRYRDYVHEEDIDAFRQYFAQVRKADFDERQELELRSNFFNNENKYLWYRFNAIAIRDLSGNIVRIIGSIKENNTEHNKRKRLESLVNKDAMTGLLNKATTKLSIEEYLSEEGKESCHAMMIIDIDSFKTVNDSFGHLFGDAVIENVATVIGSTFRKSDIVGRIGGDEFLVLMKNTDNHFPLVKAREICNAVKRTYSDNNKKIEITCSVGLAFYGIDADNYDDLFAKADIAMYHAKTSGKDRVEVYDETKSQLHAEITVLDKREYSNDNQYYDYGFVVSVFNLLLKSTNIDVSFRVATEKICNKYNLKSVVIAGTEKIYIKDEIAREKGSLIFVSKSEYNKCFNKIPELNNDDALFVVNDLEKDIRDNATKEFFEEYNIGASVCAKLSLEEDVFIYILFVNNDHVREWTGEEKKTFIEIAKVFSVFMRLRAEMIKNSLNHDSITSTEDLDSIYIRNKQEERIAASFEDALKNGEFKMYLQPKYDMIRQDVIGAEALVRWQKPDGTFVMPSDFIRVLEKYGYIEELDFYMFEQAAKTLERWENEGYYLQSVSVNFSGINSNSKDFVDRVLEVADKYNFNRQYLNIEIHENSLGKDKSVLLENLNRLRKIGFTIHLDNFGAGISSLALLMNAPIDTVKVNRVFLNTIGDSELKRDYIENLCMLISSVKKQIIFEGVETEEQAKFLLSCGISVVQGYLYDGSITLEEFEEKYM